MKIKSTAKRLNNTYQKVFRNRHKLAKEKELKDSEYRLFDLYTALYDWDKRHERYGCVVDTDKHIAEMLGWSEAKVCRDRKSLEQKGLISLVERSVVKVYLLSDQGKKPLANKKSNFFNQKENIDISEIETGIDEMNQEENSFIYSFSYKDGLSILSFEEYQKFSRAVQKIDEVIDITPNKPIEKEKLKNLVDQKEKIEKLLSKYKSEHPEHFIEEETKTDDSYDFPF